MVSWRGAALVFAAAFVLGLASLLASLALPVLHAPARALLVGAGALLAATLVAALHASLARHVREPHLADTRPLVSVHTRRR